VGGGQRGVGQRGAGGGQRGGVVGGDSFISPITSIILAASGVGEWEGT